ncbi:Annexin [Handroanthus impetiginosus]|uniref:Annexin n=1 Tax=Handroanthus impetiginosus TaxID=429701 RepID=A0A2G9HAR5_9LAMI|nr:Annexin [Handroanthus impetiginosus]
MSSISRFIAFEHDRKLIGQFYAKTYGEDVLKALDKELSSDFEHDAYLANDATKRWTSSNQVLVEIACTRSPKELLLARILFDICDLKDCCCLKSPVPSSSKSIWRKLFFLCGLWAYFIGRDDVNLTLVKSEAKLLHKRISEKAYECDDVIRILSTREVKHKSRAQINATLNQYKNEFGNDINKYLVNPEKYFEKVIRLAINGPGTDEGALTTVDVTRAAVDMMIIKGVYQKWNSVPPDGAIVKE